MIETKKLAEVDVAEYTDGTNFICEQDGKIRRVNEYKFKKQVDELKGDLGELDSRLSESITEISNDIYDITEFVLDYKSGSYTIHNGKVVNNVVNNVASAWNSVILDVSALIGKTLTIVTYADRARPILFSDAKMTPVSDAIVHDTGNPNLRWEVSVVVPNGAKYIYINHYASVVEDVSVDGYTVKELRVALKSEIPAFPVIEQSSGDSETAVMSQKAVTEYVDNHTSSSKITPISTVNNKIPVVAEDVPIYLDNLFIGISPKEAKLVDSQNANILFYDKTVARILSGKGNGSGFVRLYLTDDTKYDMFANLVYVQATAKTGTKKVLFIGDSMTENLCYINALKTISDNGNYKLSFIGTQGTTLKHEGRGGWAAYNYCNDASAYSKNNSFWDGSKFNFSWYMQNSGIAVPDYIFINLGTNDMLRGIANLNDEAEMERVITTSYQTMIDSIRQYSTAIPIVLWLPPTRSLAGRNNHIAIDKCLRANKWLINKFDKTAYISNRVYLMHTYLFVNPYTDYTMKKANIDGVEYDDCEEPIHPSTVGGEKIAKGIIRQMMYVDGVLGI